MAKPRVFVSSTFYDLKQIRAELERFIRELGYDPVLHERGSVPYGSNERLEEYCYKEIEHCDMLVAVIGGRFGTGSETVPYSITQMELKTAIESGKQVYVFVEQAVLSEYSTYKRNKAIPKVQYQYVDDIRIYEFLEQTLSLPLNNTVSPFQLARDITDYLKEQWAGLLQRFLSEQVRAKEFKILESMQSTAKTLDELVNFLTDERKNQSEAIRAILLMNHPIFKQLKEALSVTYRIFFTSRDELVAWLRNRQYGLAPKEVWDDPAYSEWIMNTPKRWNLLKIYEDIFDEQGNLRVYTAHDWNTKWVLFDSGDREAPKAAVSAEDDIPF